MVVLPFGVLAPVVLLPAIGMIRAATGRWRLATALWWVPAGLMGLNGVFGLIGCKLDLDLVPFPVENITLALTLLSAPLVALFALFVAIKSRRSR